MPVLRGTVVISEPLPFEQLAARGPRSHDHRVLGEGPTKIEALAQVGKLRSPGKSSRRQFPSAQPNGLVQLRR